MALNARQPTGRVAYPTLLVEGPSKSGRTVACLSLSADDRVGRTFVFELAENRADEYASLGPFEIVDYDGTYSGLQDQLRAAMAEPMVDDRPNVIVIDTGSALWEMLKDWASTLARSSKRARAILADDPEADIDVSSTYWNKAKDRWWSVINELKAWPGIAVIVAKAEDKTKFEGGQPTKDTVWTRELEKGTVFAVTAVVRTRYPNTPVVTDVNSLKVDMPADGMIPLPAEASLGYLIFDVLGAGGGFVQERLNTIDAGALRKGYAKQALVTRCEQIIFEHPAKPTLDSNGATDLSAAAWQAAEWPEGKSEWSTADLNRMAELAEKILQDRLDGIDQTADLPADDATAAA